MEKLKELRKARNLSQQRLAMELNISQATISKYENGTAEPDIKMIIILSNYFKITTDYLIGKSEKNLIYSESDLSDFENNLLTDFKKLSPIQKEKVLIYIKGLLQEKKFG